MVRPVSEGDVEYVRWNRVDGYLKELNFATCGERPAYIPESIFYRLAMEAKNETAEKFQTLVADEIIPSVRKHGAYMTSKTREHLSCSRVSPYFFSLISQSCGKPICRKDMSVWYSSKRVLNWGSISLFHFAAFG